MKFRSLLCSVLASAMVIGSCVCANAATYTAGSETGKVGGTVSVPITVAPSDGETSTDVNAYAIAISYDSSVLTPVEKGTDELGDATYATVGDSFSSGVLTADLKDNETGNDEVLIGWAAASAVNVTESSTLATVEFKVNTNATGTTDVNVAVAQVASSDTALVDADTITAVAGTVTIDTAKVIYGDADGNGKIESDDASLVAQAALELITFTDEQVKACDVDGNGKIESDDASLIAQRALELIESFPVESK